MEKLKNKTEEKEDETKDIGNEYNIIDLITDTHIKSTSKLSRDATLAYLDPKEKEFIRKQHLSAMKIYNFIPNKKYAKKAYNLIMSEIHDILVLERNKKTNPGYMMLLQRGLEPKAKDEIEDEGRNMKGKLKSFLIGKKEVKEKEETLIGT